MRISDWSSDVCSSDLYVNAVNIGQATDLVSTDTTLNFLPLFHTAGINLYTLPVLMHGGCVRVLRKFEVDPVMAEIRAGRCTAFFGVPAIYQAISLHGDFATTDFSRVRSWGDRKSTRLNSSH